MTRTLTTIFVTLLAALLFAGTAYADSDTDSSAASANLQFSATSSNSVYLMIGNPATVDTLTWSSLGVPSYGLIQDDAATNVAIEIDVTMDDAAQDCFLRMIGNHLVSGGNTIMIDEFYITGAGDFTFSGESIHNDDVTIDSFSTSGRYTGTFIVEYDDSAHVPPGAYAPASGYAVVFTAVVGP